MNLNDTLPSVTPPPECTAGPASSESIASRRTVLLGLGVLFFARVLFIALCPLELVPDEAYYWDWSRQLDWGYYSKPPLIAWLIALATSIGGNTELAIRFPAACLGTLGLWAIYELARRMYDPTTGLRAIVMAIAMPGLTVMSLLMTIDAPFLCAWACAVFCVWRLVETERPQKRWLFAAIASTGFGLLAKQTMLGLFPLVLLFLAASPLDRKQLKSPVVWIWVLASLAFLTPVIWWNSQHDWITIQHTREHFGGEAQSVMEHVLLSLEFWATQFGILSPMLCSMMLCVVGSLLWKLPSLPRRELFLICLGGLPMIAVGGLSLLQHVQPNWPAAFHVTSLILVAAWVGQRESPAVGFARLRRWFPVAIVIGAFCSLLVVLAPIIVAGTSLAGTRLDPTVRLRGWKSLSAEVDRKLSEFPSPQDTLIVATTKRGPVSELAFYLIGRPRVYLWNSHPLPLSQHDVWSGPQGAEGRDALILTPLHVDLPARFAAAFESIEDRGPIVISLGPQRSRSFRVWRGVALRAWPARQLYLTRPKLTHRRATIVLSLRRRDVLSAERQDYSS